MSIKRGFGFGVTSGVITTLGLLVGLAYGTNSKKVVLGGILLIAIADTLSDALGMHVSEEFGNKKASEKQIWKSTFSTVFFKFIVALTFTLPILLFNLSLAIIISIIWGALLLSVFSYYIGCQRKQKPFPIIFEHILIAGIVIAITYFLGKWIATWAV